MLKFTAFQIAQLLQGEVQGNPDVEISQISKIEEGKTGSIAFFANPKYEAYVYSTEASAVLVSKDFVPKQAHTTTLIRVNDAYTAFTFLLQKAQEMLHATKVGIEQPSFISPTAKIGKNVYVGAFAYIGHYATIGDNVKIYPNAHIGDNAVIGDNTTIFANATVYFDCKIGKNCVLHSGSVVGSDGFGHAPQKDGTYLKVPQMGNVVIEDDVEIGANSTVDRATMGSTFIRQGVKLDNLVQIAHNCEVGKHTVIAALSGIGGSTKIGAYCMIGGQVGMVGHITICDHVKIGAKAGIAKNITEENTIWRGAPAQDYRKQLKAEVLFQQLDTLVKRVQELEKINKEKTKE